MYRVYLILPHFKRENEKDEIVCISVQFQHRSKNTNGPYRLVFDHIFAGTLWR